MNYEKDMAIDPEALDTEFLKQASMMLKYCQHSARMRMEVDKAKQDLDIAKAEADKNIRDDPEKYGINKVTETAIANAVLIEKGYKKAYSSFLETKYEADMAQAAVNAFEHRKSALENLVRLFGQQYFAGPKLPRDLNKEWEQKKKQESADSKVVMTRKNTTE